MVKTCLAFGAGSMMAVDAGISKIVLAAETILQLIISTLSVVFSFSASVDNTLLDLLNSSYPIQPHSLIAN